MSLFASTGSPDVGGALGGAGLRNTALTPPYPIMVVDDHPAIRAGIAAFLEADPRFRVVGQAANAGAAQDLAIRVKPAIVIMDINMPGRQALEVLQLWRLTWSSLRVVMCSSHSDLPHVRAMLSAGACGYILKEEYPETYIEGLIAVAEGKVWLSPALRAKLTKHNPHDLGAMSAREIRVLRALGHGQTVAEIAAAGREPLSAVNEIVYALMSRLGVNSLAEVAAEGLILAQDESL